MFLRFKFNKIEKKSLRKRFNLWLTIELYTGESIRCKCCCHCLSSHYNGNVLLLVSQSVTQGNFSISVSYHSFSKVEWWKKIGDYRNDITLFKRVVICKETIQSGNVVLLFFWITKPHGDHPKKCKQINKPPKIRFRTAVSRFRLLFKVSHSMNIS